MFSAEKLMLILNWYKNTCHFKDFLDSTDFYQNLDPFLGQTFISGLKNPFLVQNLNFLAQNNHFLVKYNPFSAQNIHFWAKNISFWAKTFIFRIKIFIFWLKCAIHQEKCILALPITA